MDLRDFQSILLFFSEEEIEELQAAIDKRRSKRLSLTDENSLERAGQPDYSPNGVEAVFFDIRIEHPA